MSVHVYFRITSFILFAAFAAGGFAISHLDSPTVRNAATVVASSSGDPGWDGARSNAVAGS